MPIVPFTYYLHDQESRYEFADEILNRQLQLGLSEDEMGELMEKIGRPFYEVKFTCTLDTDTGKVEIVEVKL